MVGIARDATILSLVHSRQAASRHRALQTLYDNQVFCTVAIQPKSSLQYFLNV